MATELSLLIGVARAAPPETSAVSMLAPARTISSAELDGLGQPVVVLGGPPCHHWRDAITSRNDLLYVEVPAASVETSRYADRVLPNGHPQLVRRQLGHLLELKQRYLGNLPRLRRTDFSWKNVCISITPTESDLLQVLFDHEGEIVGRDELARVCGCPNDRSRAVDAHVHRLRRKLAIPGVEIRTERQRGFKLVLE